MKKNNFYTSILIGILVALTALVIILTSPTASAVTEDRRAGYTEVFYTTNITATLPGDANRDGAVNVGDIVKIERMILTVDPTYSGADANRSKSVNMADVTKVERIILEIDAIPGDANGDKAITQADITKIQRVILGLDQPTKGSDANLDGQVNIADVAEVESMLLGN